MADFKLIEFLNPREWRWVSHPDYVYYRRVGHIDCQDHEKKWLPDIIKRRVKK